MKKMLISTLAVCAVGSNLHAGCASSWCTGVDITRIMPTEGGSIYIGTSGDESTLNCTSPGNVYMTLKAGGIGTNSIYSLLLTAQTTKKQVMIRVRENTNGCTISYAYML